MGRKSKLTPELQGKLIEAISNGNSVETSCALSGINPDTFYDWLKRGENPGSAFSEFSDGIRKARAESESWHVANIKKHAARSWAASAWHLERSNPERWALRKPEPQTERPEGEESPNASKDIRKAAWAEYLAEHPEVELAISAKVEERSP